MTEPKNTMYSSMPGKFEFSQIPILSKDIPKLN